MANNLESYKWETTFETSKDLMIHTFTDRVSVVTNIKTGKIKVLRDGVIIETIDNPAVLEYEKFLLRISEAAQDLDNLHNNDNT